MAKSSRFLVPVTILLIIVLTLVSACGAPAQSPGDTAPVAANKVQRIVSLSPSTTELLFALGLGDKVVGDTEYCDYPEQANSIAKIGGYSTVDIEKVVSLKPDLVVGSDIHEATVVPALQKLGIKAVTMNPLTLNDLLQSATRLGDLTGQTEGAARLRSSLDSRIKAVAGRVSSLPKPRVFYFYWHDPIWTSGSGTLADDVIKLAGGENIASGLSGAAMITLETVLSKNPQVIIVATGHGDTSEAPYQFVGNTPALKTTDAVTNNRVFTIDGNIIERSGPRIVDALEVMAGLIHPVGK